MTGYDSRIVDLNGIPADPAVLYLHHAVLGKDLLLDLTCPLMPERFAAAGAERIPIALPRGYGYRLRGGEIISNILHIQNFSLTPKQCYYQFSMNVEPGDVQPPLREVRPWWLDVRTCTSNYSVPPGTGLHVRSQDYTVPGNVAVLEMGPHLHCGGIKLEFINKTAGRTIHTFTNAACPVEMQPVLPQPPLMLTGGTVVTLQATYQQKPTEPIDAMGIMLAYIVFN
jgi:hypothetical protein